ncbi:MAG TPA: phospholipase, partial [Arthrobacter bacterium]|nr:phospholipase [Arthrobacter sp.]
MTSPRATARPPRAASRRRPLVAALSLAVLLLLAAVLTGQGPSVRPAQSSGQGTAEGISKIKHVVIITQENRSFDSYFGTYPGADGIPMQNGVPTVCLPDPAHGGCVQPFYNAADSNAGAPHSHADEVADVNNGAMDGFVAQAEKGLAGCKATDTHCQYGTKQTDVMGYHDGRDLPDYWAYAQNYTLQDHMFAAVSSWSLPAHLYLVSEWSAKCTTDGDPSSCTNALQTPGIDPDPEIIQ